MSAYAELYDRFIIAGANMTRDREWSDRIDTVTERIVSALTASGSETEEYGAALKTFSGDLETAGNLDQIRGLVADIITETDSMDTRTRELYSQVSKSTEEITDLRKALDDSRRDALTDSLTGIANRKCFDQKIFSAVEESLANGETRRSSLRISIISRISTTPTDTSSVIRFSGSSDAHFLTRSKARTLPHDTVVRSSRSSCPIRRAAAQPPSPIIFGNPSPPSVWSKRGRMTISAPSPSRSALPRITRAKTSPLSSNARIRRSTWPRNWAATASSAKTNVSRLPPSAPKQLAARAPVLAARDPDAAYSIP